MGPSLHQWYTSDEALAAFGDARSAEFLCDGQFVALPKAILCLATVGDPATESSIVIPCSFCWKPGRLDYDPADEIPWLPAKAREVYGPDRERIKEHHIFLRAPGDERFVYVGSAHLGSWGNNGIPGNEVGGFSLEVKLPRDLWLHLGGYPGWCAVLNHQEACFLDKADVDGFQRLVDELPRQENAHLELTRYEEDRLFVAMNPRRGWLSYMQSFRGGFGVHARDVDYAGDPESIEFFWCDCGLEMEAPAAHTLPHELCMRAAVEFFQTGELPHCVHWDDGQGGESEPRRF
jgi:Immunity protein Imm1